MKNSSTQSRRHTSNGTSRSQANSRSELKNLDPIGDFQAYARQYVREQPEMSMLACLGIGFILGWKLKPW